MLSQTRQRASSKVLAERLPELRAIQAKASQEVLPRVLDELGIPENDEKCVHDWLEDWLGDVGQLFRLYKKHDFDSESTLKAVEDNLTWRYKNLLDLKPLTAPCRFLRFLPHPLITSSTSKESCPPILYLSLKELSAYAREGSPAEKVEQVKSLMMNVFELARMYLKELDMILESRIGSAKGKEKEDPERLRIFQFALMVDVQGAGMLPTGGSDIASWVNNELSPRYPGMCGSVYIVNYSWAYSALWAVVKRVLPAKVLSRISFPSASELLQHFPSEFFLKEHGGSLPALSPDTDEVMCRYQKLKAFASSDGEDEESSSLSSSTVVPADAVATPPPATVSPPPPPPTEYISAFSPRNPFFGYPIVVHHELLPDGTYAAIPSLVHGRRRKRDLIKTLAFLFVLKWRKRVEIWLRVLVSAFRNMQATMWKRWHVLKAVSRMFGVPTVLGSKRFPLVLAVAVVLATITMQLRRVALKGGVFSSLSYREIRWLRDVFTMSLGGVAATAVTAVASLPSPFLSMDQALVFY